MEAPGSPPSKRQRRMTFCERMARITSRMLHTSDGDEEHEGARTQLPENAPGGREIAAAARDMVVVAASPPQPPKAPLPELQEPMQTPAGQNVVINAEIVPDTDPDTDSCASAGLPCKRSAVNFKDDRVPHTPWPGGSSQLGPQSGQPGLFEIHDNSDEGKRKRARSDAIASQEQQMGTSGEALAALQQRVHTAPAAAGLSFLSSQGKPAALLDSSKATVSTAMQSNERFVAAAPDSATAVGSSVSGLGPVGPSLPTCRCHGADAITANAPGQRSAQDIVERPACTPGSYDSMPAAGDLNHSQLQMPTSRSALDMQPAVAEGRGVSKQAAWAVGARLQQQQVFGNEASGSHAAVGNTPAAMGGGHAAVGSSHATVGGSHAAMGRAQGAKSAPEPHGSAMQHSRMLAAGAPRTGTRANSGSSKPTPGSLGQSHHALAREGLQSVHTAQGSGTSTSGRPSAAQHSTEGRQMRPQAAAARSEPGRHTSHSSRPEAHALSTSVVATAQQVAQASTSRQGHHLPFWGSAANEALQRSTAAHRDSLQPEQLIQQQPAQASTSAWGHQASYVAPRPAIVAGSTEAQRGSSRAHNQVHPLTRTSELPPVPPGSRSIGAGDISGFPTPKQPTAQPLHQGGTEAIPACVALNAPISVRTPPKPMERISPREAFRPAAKSLFAADSQAADSQAPDMASPSLPPAFYSQQLTGSQGQGAEPICGQPVYSRGGGVPSRVAVAVNADRMDGVEGTCQADGGFADREDEDEERDLVMISQPALASQPSHSHRRNGAPHKPTPSTLGREASEPSRLAADYLPDVPYREKLGVRDLWPWQARCLSLSGVMQGRNVVYSVPTGAGKSAVAEILILRRIHETKLPVIVVLPYGSLCGDIANKLVGLFAGMSREVIRFWGPRSRLGAVDPAKVGAIVCTIEKANQLVNRMLEEDNLKLFSAVVVDELHMVDNDDRGYHLELLLTKLRYKCLPWEQAQGSQGGSQVALQIIGMSATMPNAAQVANWLDAALLEDDFRPVPVYKYLKDGRDVLDESGAVVRKLECNDEWARRDPDLVALLCKETLDAGHSVLVFCPTRRFCEQIAELVASMVDIAPLSHDRAQLVKDLEGVPKKGSKWGKLGGLLQRGVAFHNSDLESGEKGEREIVERGFKSGAIRMLAATSTLATGVNMPARRVILFRHWQGMNSHWLSTSEYQQMAGRAGRFGHDDVGEVYLIRTREAPQESLLNLMRDKARRIESCLTDDRRGMTQALLDAIASGMVSSANDINKYMRCTLLAHTQDFQAEKGAAKSALAALKELVEKRLIRRIQGVGEGREAQCSTSYEAEMLGKAAMASGLDPEQALMVHKDLKKARDGFIMATDLHIMYLVTPIREDLLAATCRGNTAKQKDILYKVYKQMSPLELKVAGCLGLKDHEVHGLCQMNRKHAETDRICRRLFSALAMLEAIQETPEEEIVRRFAVSPKENISPESFQTRFRIFTACLKDLKEHAHGFASKMALFCQRMQFTHLEVMIAKFQERLYLGVKQELVALVEIQFVKGHTARLLYDAGLRTVEAVATYDVTKLAAILAKRSHKLQGDASTGRVDKGRAREIRRSARLLLKAKAEEVAREAEEKAQVARQAMKQEQASQLCSSSLEDSQEAATADLNKDVFRKGIVSITDPLLQQLQTAVAAEPVFAFALHLENTVSIAKFASGTGSPTSTQVRGYAIAWKGRVAYVAASAAAWELARNLFASLAIKATYDLKAQLKALKGLCVGGQEGLVVGQPVQDVRISEWLLRPDSGLVSDNPTDEPRKQHNKKWGLEGLLDRRGALGAVREITHCQWNTSDARYKACNAAVGCLLLQEAQQPLLEQEGLLNALTGIETPLVPVLAEMERVGVLLDCATFEECKLPLLRRLQAIEEEVGRLAGCDVIDSLSSPQVVQTVLWERLKLEPPRCAGKRLSTKAEVLEELAPFHPVPGLILEHRSISHLLSSMEGFTDFATASQVGRQQRVRTSWLHTGCGSGRLHCEDPNLQCVPKARSFHVPNTQTSGCRTQEANIRSAFVAPRGWVLISADYCQLEMRMMAHLSGDARLCHILQNDEDPFRIIAANWHGSSQSQVTPKQRDDVKQLVYGIIYGMGKKALAKKLGCSDEHAQSLQDGLRERYPELTQWLAKVVQDCRAATGSHHVTTIAGRRRYFKDIVSANPRDRAAAERQAVNTTVQGSAADVAKHAMILLQAGIEDRARLPPDSCRQIMQIHDELVVEANERVLAQAAALLKQSMEGAWNLRVPLRVKVNVGGSWGQLAPYTL